jgi:hypothetical protein
MSLKKRIDYLMFRLQGRIVKIDPDIYYRIFNRRPENPAKYNDGITGMLFSGDYPTLVFGKKPCRHVRLSRFVMNAKDGQIVDHINRKPLDNRRCNLRFATQRQNSLNRKCKNTSGYIGVAINPKKKGGYYCLAKFKLADGKERGFRISDSPENRIIAAFARDRFVLEAGEEEYAPLNFPCFKYEPFRTFLLNENLRLLTKRQIGLNVRRENSSGYLGVTVKHDRSGYFCLAKFQLANGKAVSFRLPDSPENRIIAAFARDKFVLQQGEEDYAPLNFPCFKYEPFRSFLLQENLRKYKKFS